MRIEKLKTELLIPADYNPRKDLKPGDPEYEKPKRSIEKFGWTNFCDCHFCPLVISYDQ